eukprot:scaffold41394_cov144-Skeletonema_dohrnii-CCMP3373.AAC.2
MQRHRDFAVGSLVGRREIAVIALLAQTLDTIYLCDETAIRIGWSETWPPLTARSLYYYSPTRSWVIGDRRQVVTKPKFRYSQLEFIWAPP